MSLRTTLLATLLAIAVAAPAPASAAPTAAKSKPRPAKSKRARLLEKALETARAQRAEVIAEARASDDPQAGAARLAEATLELGDPALAVEAAAAYHDLRTAESTLKALQLISAAREQLAAYVDPDVDRSVDVRTIRLTRAEVDALLARCVVLDEQATALHQKIVARQRTERRARKELRAGAVATGLGVAGLGVLVGGLAVRADRRDKLAAIAGDEQRYDLSGLDAQSDRAGAMIAAGAITGVVGLVTGAVLLGLGARDLRGARPSGRHARVQVTPTTGGLLVVGRF
jgi:hypothetical protein